MNQPIGSTINFRINSKTDAKDKIKYVKKAGQWCLTRIENDKQVQKWFETKEEAEKFAREL